MHHTTVESVILDSYSGARMTDWLKVTAGCYCFGCSIYRVHLQLRPPGSLAAYLQS
jgi:hypothetical protein